MTCDVGFIEGPQTHPDLLVHPWLVDELVIVAAPGHPLAARRRHQPAAGACALDPARAGLRHAPGRRQLADRTPGRRCSVEFELGSTRGHQAARGGRRGPGLPVAPCGGSGAGRRVAGRVAHPPAQARRAAGDRRAARQAARAGDRGIHPPLQDLKRTTRMGYRPLPFSVIDVLAGISANTRTNSAMAAP